MSTARVTDILGDLIPKEYTTVGSFRSTDDRLDNCMVLNRDILSDLMNVDGLSNDITVKWGHNIKSPPLNLLRSDMCFIMLSFRGYEFNHKTIRWAGAETNTFISMWRILDRLVSQHSELKKRMHGRSSDGYISKHNIATESVLRDDIKHKWYYDMIHGIESRVSICKDYSCDIRQSSTYDINIHGDNAGDKDKIVITGDEYNSDIETNNLKSVTYDVKGYTVSTRSRSYKTMEEMISESIKKL